MKKLAVLFLFLVGSSALAQNAPVQIHCGGKVKNGQKLVASGVFDASDRLLSFKAFYIFSNGQKPNAAYFLVKTNPAGTTNPDTNKYFNGDGHGDSTTVYLPNKLASRRGTTVGLMIVSESDGAGKIPPEKLACNVL
jgi:hypothetical protein